MRPRRPCYLPRAGAKLRQVKESLSGNQETYEDESRAVCAASGQIPARMVPTSTPIAASAATVVPALVPHSGIAMGDDGKPFAGETGVTFLIYKDEQGGEPLWAETQTVTFDSSGRGEANPQPP